MSKDHQIPWSFGYVISLAFEMFNIYLAVNAAEINAQSHFYYWEFGYRIGQTIAEVMILLDFVFDL